jgi:hypothetical protein
LAQSTRISTGASGPSAAAHGCAATTADNVSRSQRADADVRRVPAMPTLYIRRRSGRPTLRARARAGARGALSHLAPTRFTRMDDDVVCGPSFDKPGWQRSGDPDPSRATAPLIQGSAALRPRVVSVDSTRSRAVLLQQSRLHHPLPHRPSTARPLPLNSEGCDGRFYLQPQSFRLHSAHLGWPEPRTYEDGAGPGPAAVWTGFDATSGWLSRAALSESEDRAEWRCDGGGGNDSPGGGTSACAGPIDPGHTPAHRPAAWFVVVARRVFRGVRGRPGRRARTRPPVWRVARQKFRGRAIPSVAWASASK